MEVGVEERALIVQSKTSQGTTNVSDDVAHKRRLAQRIQRGTVSSTTPIDR